MLPSCLLNLGHFFVRGSQPAGAGAVTFLSFCSKFKGKKTELSQERILLKWMHAKAELDTGFPSQSSDLVSISCVVCALKLLKALEMQ